MKERTIKIVVLGIVFIAALIGFSFWTNRGNADMTADMDAATLPTLSFMVEGKEVNLLVGHKQEMNVVSMRDTIAICDEQEKLTVKISHNENGYDSLKYEVYSLDGTEQLYEDSIDKIENEMTLDFKGVLKKDREAVLKLTVKKGETSLYYYTRIAKDNEYHVKECLDYVQELHTNMLTKENEDAVKKVMEANASGDNSTLQHVTIHSDLKHSMWGELKPEIVGDLHYEIKETKTAYTSVLLSYQVKCAGDNNKEELYNVKEFFKVSYGKERIYLLEYDRTTEEIFNTSNVVMSSKGIILGLADKNLAYKVNEKGTIVAFVQANELWNYNKEKDAFTLVFSFADAEKEDVRNWLDHHSIQLLSMESNGSMTFSVCGYMNRGIHEGESGIAIYYYDISKNIVEEVAFIPSSDSRLVIESELSELAFYNKEQGVLYTMVDGTLLKVAFEKNERTVLIEGLQKGQYVASADGRLLAYQKTNNGTTETEIWDFAEDSKRIVEVESGEVVVPLGFVGSDFVYGISRPEDVGVDVLGSKVQGMNRLEIRNINDKVLKTYQKQGVYILAATIGNNQITLKQGTKSGNVYQETTEDYITNNETSANEQVKLDSYWTDLKQTQYRFAFANGIKDKKAKTMKTKQMLVEAPTTLEFEKDANAKYYYVYGLGEQKGIYENGGDAIALADALSGVVISPKQNYAWEDGNRVSWYRNFEVNRFTPNAGESTLAACVRRVLAYEGKKVDVASEMGDASVEQIMEKHLKTEALRFRGCSSESMRYLIDKGVPVIAMKDGSDAILLIGYDAKTVTYIEPSSGSIFTSTFEKVDEMLAGSGKTFIGYVR